MQLLDESGLREVSNPGICACALDEVYVSNVKGNLLLSRQLKEQL